MTKTLDTPEIRKKLAGLGAVLNVGTSEGFGMLMHDEIGKWEKVIQAAGVKVE